MKHPLCALCGKKLSGAHIRFQWKKLAGKPTVGWHADVEGVVTRRPVLLCCAWLDPVFKALVGRKPNSGNRAVDYYTRVIAERGPGRVVTLK